MTYKGGCVSPMEDRMKGKVYVMTYQGGCVSPMEDRMKGKVS